MSIILRGKATMASSYPLGEYLYKTRKDRDLSIRELSRQVEKHLAATGTTISAAYYSQVETGSGKINPEKISFDFFWAVSCILKIDPVYLWLLSRPGIPKEYHDPQKRKYLFDLP